MLTPEQQRRVERVEEYIDYRTQRPEEEYLWESVQVAGSGQNRIGGRNVPVGNKNLALAGDTIMATLASHHWYTQHGSLGEWDNLRQRYLSDGNLAQVATDTQLIAEMNCNPRQPVHPSVKMSATLVEAIIGAVYFDSEGDMEAVKKVMIHLGFGEIVGPSNFTQDNLD